MGTARTEEHVFGARAAVEPGALGLGLYIVSRLTGALGGEIAVDSRVGAGSRFTVSVPLDAPVAVGPRPGRYAAK
jgi:signal transduction histidine kinase